MSSPRLLGSALSLGLVLAPGLALGAPDPAEELFDRGVAAMEAGRYEEGCPPIEQSYRIDPRLGTLFTLAECESKRGHIAAAVTRYEEYLTAHGKLPRDKKSKQGDRGAVARRQIDLLRPQLPHLTLVLPPSAPEDIEVLCDGAPLGKSSLTAPVPLDPGAHVIATRAQGYASSEVRFPLARGQEMRLELTLGAKIAGATPPLVPGSSAVAPTSTPADSDAHATSGRRVGAYVTGSVGVAGLILGGVLGGLAIAKKRAVDANCKPTSDPGTLGCHGEGFAASQSLHDLELGSTVGFGVGAAAVVPAVVLFATEPRKPRKEARARGRATPTAAASPAGVLLGVEGAW